jgi:hypothetical protein
MLLSFVPVRSAIPNLLESILLNLELYTWVILVISKYNVHRTVKIPWISISINLFFSKLNLLVIKGEFDKGLLTTKIMKKRKLLFKQRCARSSYYLAIKLSPVRAWKVPIPPDKTVSSKHQQECMQYVIYLPKGNRRFLLPS